MHKYSEQFKLAVVEQYLNTTDGQKLTARHFGINYRALRAWAGIYQQHGLKGRAPKHGYYSYQNRPRQSANRRVGIAQLFDPAQRPLLAIGGSAGRSEKRGICYAVR